MSRYKGRHRASAPAVWQRPAVVVPATATAVVAATVGVTASSSGEAALGATHHASADTPTAANTLWQRQSAHTGTSRSALRTADAAQAKAVAANSARAKQHSADLAKQKAATSSDLKKAADSAKAARSAATKRAASAAKATTKTSSASNATRATSASTASAPTAGGWTCAISGCGGVFTSGFGGRWGRMHQGDDFAVPIGTPLHALHSGTVVAVGPYYGFGNRVEIDYGGGIHSVFGHMSGFSVSVGQQVTEGQVVGYSGNTGHSTGPHLHIEIHLGGQPVNPAPWLKAHGIF